MDIPEQRYRKLIQTFKPALSNVISQYPIPLQHHLPHTRNLKYIIQKQKYSNTLPFTFYSQFPQQIKQQLNDPVIENRLLAIRLIRCLPFYYRVKTVQATQNVIGYLLEELSMFMSRQAKLESPGKKYQDGTTTTTPEFHYESVADMVDLLLSIYELTGLSQQIYFDVNQKITAILSHILQKCFSTDRNISRNSYQALRAIFLLFGQCMGRVSHKKTMEDIKPEEQMQILNKIQKNKLVNKIVTLFSKNQNYMLSVSSSSNIGGIGSASNLQGNSSSTASNPYLRQLIMKTREYQIRVRCRMLTGISYLLTYVPQSLPQLYQLLTQQIFIILQNVNQFDISLQTFLTIKPLLSLPLSHQLRISIIKKWVSVLSELSSIYKKQYFPFYIQILQEVSQYQYSPLRVKFFVSINFLQITASITQQLSRFIVYKFSCREIMNITNRGALLRNTSYQKVTGSSKKINGLQGTNIILNIFHYSWFINRVKNQNDLFRYQFLISMLHSYFSHPQLPSINNKSQLKDLLDLCHFLLDWNYSSKQDSHIPTIKFAIDIYLQFLKEAAYRLNTEIEQYLKQLIQICNGQNINLLFKFKLITTIVKLQIYSKNIITYSEIKLKLDFLQGEVAPFMMPKNPKPIFDYEYSLTIDGQIQSRKQIQTIKVIMELLAAIEQVQKNNPTILEIVNNMVIHYHEYLSNLQMQKTSNKDLINCLQSLQADHYFTDCQRNFLLALIQQQQDKGNNIQHTLNDCIVYSPFESFDSDQQYNIFGEMSPVHLKIRLLGGRSYTSVFIEAKKSQWVSLPDLKLVISSTVQIKQVPFQSSIIEIKIDRSGLINFQVWTIQGTPLMLGSGSHRVNRKFRWLSVNHLKIIDGIRSKAFLARQELSAGKHLKQPKDATYLSYCFGEPVLLQIIYSRNEIVVTVNNKEIWNELQELIGKMVEELMDGVADVVTL